MVYLTIHKKRASGLEEDEENCLESEDEKPTKRRTKRREPEFRVRHDGGGLRLGPFALRLCSVCVACRFWEDALDMINQHDAVVGAAINNQRNDR